MSTSFIGIDVHKRNCVFSEIDARGKVIRGGDLATMRQRYRILPVG
jgi:hypothetical protein